MNWEILQELFAEEFRRLTGVKRKTFEEMLKLLRSEKFNNRLIILTKHCFQKTYQPECTNGFARQQ